MLQLWQLVRNRGQRNLIFTLLFHSGFQTALKKNTERQNEHNKKKDCLRPTAASLTTHRVFLPSELISRASSGMPKCPLEWHIFLLKHHFTIHAPCALRPLDKNSLMTDISSECEASGYARFRTEMLPMALFSASQGDSLEPRKQFGRVHVERKGRVQSVVCAIFVSFYQSLKQIKGSIKYHTPLASSGAWREDCLE